MTTATSPIRRSALAAPALEPAVVVAALRRAAADPSAVALVDGATGASLTRGELAARSAALAAGLRARDVGRGDLVAVTLPNGLWWPVVALAVWRAGAAISPLNPLWTADESARVLAGAVPKLAIGVGPFATKVDHALRAAGLAAEVVVVGDPTSAAPGAGVPPDGATAALTPIADLMDADPGDPFAEPDPDPGDVAAVPFSSGTSGLPKGVRLTHGNLAAAAAQGVAGFRSGGDYDERSVVLAGAPFFHSIGLALMLCAPLSLGARIITVPIPKVEALLELIGAHRVTHMAVPPPIFDALADDPRVDDVDVSSVRLVITGGAHMRPEGQLALSERMGCIARQGYGTTETTCTIACPHDGPSDPATNGWLAAGTEARLVDPETGEDAAPGELGELWVRGPQVMEGYHGLPEATAEILTPEGWLRTGDLVAFRDDGQLEIRDRLKELIKVKGASVAPAEVELVLRQHPAVRDCGVVGLPDRERGEAPVALVSLRDAVSPEELHAFVAERLAGYKRPREIVLVDEVPRSPTGKLLRRALRERAPA